MLIVKYLTVLQALSSCQAQSRNLSAYVKDRVIGTWQPTNTQKCGLDEEQ